MIRSMCSGRYSVKFAQKAFELGAGAVLYSGCHLPADCHFQTGNHWMAKREPRIRAWMKRNEIPDQRFRVEWVSAGEGKKWQGIMTEMASVAMEHAKEVRSTPAKPKPKSSPRKATSAKTNSKPKKSASKQPAKKKTPTKRSKKKE